MTFLLGDCRETLKTIAGKSVQTCVTSPPYFGLRDYEDDAQIGLENTVDEYVHSLVDVFREVKRVLKDDGTLWLNLGDSYNSGAPGARDPNRWPKQSRNDPRPTSRPIPQDGLKPKDLIGVPWRVAFALQADGWYLRQDIIWSKPNPMPESVRDRCTKAHEYIFLLTKSPKYYFDNEAIREPLAESSKERVKHAWKCSTPAVKNKDGIDVAEMGSRIGNPAGRNKRSVWTIPPKPFKGAHFATYPPELITPCILAGSREGDIVLDPFGGSGTTALVSKQFNRDFIYCDANAEYMAIAMQRVLT